MKQWYEEFTKGNKGGGRPILYRETTEKAALFRVG